MFIGRVVCDAEGRLNANSLLLEGTLKHSQGTSVKLDVSRLTAYRLFPGQAGSTPVPILPRAMHAIKIDQPLYT